MKRLKSWILLSTIGTVSVLATGFSAEEGETTTAARKKTPGRIERLESKLAADPDNVRLLGRLGVAYSIKARDSELPIIDLAVPLLEKGARLDSDDLWIHQQLGAAYLIQALNYTQSPTGARLNEAISAFERARTTFEGILDKRPQDSYSLASHGLALLGLSGLGRQRQLMPKAIDEMNRAIEMDPLSLQPRLVRAFSFMAFPPQQFPGKAAIEDLTSLLDHVASGENEKARGVLHVLLGDAWLRLEDSAKARREYTEALEVSSPARSEAQDRLKMLEAGKTNWRKILAYDAIGSRCTECHGAGNVR